jgi:hypothetical protein
MLGQLVMCCVHAADGEEDVVCMQCVCHFNSILCAKRYTFPFYSQRNAFGEQCAWKVCHYQDAITISGRFVPTCCISTCALAMRFVTLPCACLGTV